MNSILQRWRGVNPTTRRLDREVVKLQHQQRDIEAMVEKVIAQLQTIIDQNDKIVQALDKGGLLNGHER